MRLTVPGEIRKEDFSSGHGPSCPEANAPVKVTCAVLQRKAECVKHSPQALGLGSKLVRTAGAFWLQSCSLHIVFPAPE